NAVSRRHPHVGIKSLSMSGAFAELLPSGHGSSVVRFHALADREAFAPQDLAALLITLDLVSHSAGRLLFSSGGQLSAVTQGLDVPGRSGHRSGSRGAPPNRLNTTARFKLHR